MHKGIKMGLKGHDDPTLDAVYEVQRRQAMTIIRVPKDIATSPQDGSQLTFNPETRLFKDESGNLYGLDDLAGARPGNRIKKWVEENYPQDKRG